MDKPESPRRIHWLWRYRHWVVGFALGFAPAIGREVTDAARQSHSDLIARLWGYGTGFVFEVMVMGAVGLCQPPTKLNAE